MSLLLDGAPFKFQTETYCKHSSSGRLMRKPRSILEWKGQCQYYWVPSGALLVTSHSHLSAYLVPGFRATQASSSGMLQHLNSRHPLLSSCRQLHAPQRTRVGLQALCC